MTGVFRQSKLIRAWIRACGSLKKNLDRDIKDTHFNVRSWYCGCNHDSLQGNSQQPISILLLVKTESTDRFPCRFKAAFLLWHKAASELLQVLTWVVHKNYKMWCEIYKKCKLNKFCIDGAFYLPCGLHVLGVMKTAADVLRFLCSKDKGSPRANILVWLVWGSLKGKNKTRLSIIDKRYLNMLLNFMLTQRTSWHSAICLLGRKVQLDLLLAGLWSVGEKISQPSAHRWCSDTLFDSVAN